MSNIINRLKRCHRSSSSSSSSSLLSLLSINKYQSTLSIKIDLSKPHLWYPNTRNMKRKIICHIGPTNSGKTFNALQSLKSSQKGIYLGPLRLLAWEIATKLRDENIPCNLLTGQENEIDNNARHLSCTVEMCDFQNVYDCCVIDEIQLIGDRTRGYAFTNAILGIQSSEIHVCGSSNVLKIIEKICEQTNDELIIKKYERLSNLTVANKALKSLKNVKTGDCIVGFGRRTLYDIKEEIQRFGEKNTKVCVIYGNLPPIARREQARLFSDPSSGYNVLVATDAVGMGLNLSINRIIFTQIEKFDGQKRRLLSSSEIKQIGGRAGRGDANGIITCLDPKDLSHIHQCIKADDKPITKAGLSLNFDLLELLSIIIDNNIDTTIMERFWFDHLNRELNNDDYDNTNDIAEKLSNQGLSIALINKYFKTFENFKRVFKLFLLEWNDSMSRDGYEEKGRKERRRTSFSAILKIFKAHHEINESKNIYFLCDLNEMIEIAQQIDHVPFNLLRDRHIFCSAPVKHDNKIIIDNFVIMAEDFVKYNKVYLKMNTSYNVSTPEKLYHAESIYHVMEIYVWLSNKYGLDVFPDKILCDDEIKKLNVIITEALKRFNLSKKELNKRKKEEKMMMIKNEKKIVELLDV